MSVEIKEKILDTCVTIVSVPLGIGFGLYTWFVNRKVYKGMEPEEAAHRVVDDSIEKFDKIFERFSK